MKNNNPQSTCKNDEIKIKTISTKAKTRKEKIWKEENMQE